MKNQKNTFRLILTAISLSVIVFVSGQSIYAQRYLSEFKDRSESKGIANFGNDLVAFLTLAQEIDAKPSIVSPRIIAQLESLGKKVQDGTSNFRSNLKGLIAKFKSDNRWDNDLDNEITETVGSRRAKGFFQRVGGRKILNDTDGVIGSINVDVDAIINDAKKLNGSVTFENSIFMNASFAPTVSARKLRFKCLVLGAAIFGAEIAKAPKTAENLDAMFDKNGCGAGAGAAT